VSSLVKFFATPGEDVILTTICDTINVSCGVLCNALACYKVNGTEKTRIYSSESNRTAGICRNTQLAILRKTMTLFFVSCLQAINLARVQSNLAKTASNASNVPILYNGQFLHWPARHRKESGLPSITTCLGSSRVSTRSSTSINSTIFAQRRRVTDWLTAWLTTLRDYRSQ